MGTTVLYKKISSNRIQMKVLDDSDYFNGNAEKIRKDFIGNRTKTRIIKI